MRHHRNLTLSISALLPALLFGTMPAAHANDEHQIGPWNFGKKRFVVLEAFNGEAVMDMATGLIWEKSPVAGGKVWRDAVIDCYRKQVGGHLGWRLPTIEELAGLVNPSASAVPRLPDRNPFTIQSNLFWSITTYGTPGYTGNAWNVNFIDGQLDYNAKTLNSPSAWCVLGGHGYDGGV